MKHNAGVHRVAVLALLLALLPGSASAQTTARVGLYFDPNGNSCSTTLEPFDPIGVQAYVLAWMDPGIDFAGAFFSVQLPTHINVVPSSVRWPRDTDVRGDMLSSNGVDLQFQVCPRSTAAPITLVSFVLTDISLGGTRPDLLIDVLGGTIAAEDTLTLLEPNLKVCDPQDPEGYSSLIVAPGTQAHLNCSSGVCPCTETAVTTTTWTAVRKLYADD